MKKLISGMFAAILMTAGLVAATGGTASANCTPSQYSGCVDTKTKIFAPNIVPRGTKAKVCATVKAKGSNATPVGTVKFKVTRNAGGVLFKKKLAYSGGKICVKTKRLWKVGGYTVRAKFKSPAGSIFMNSKDTDGFDVVR